MMTEKEILSRERRESALTSKNEVLWLNTKSDRPVGLVKHFDEIEGRWKYYIGTGYGIDMDHDVRTIIAFGQKFDSLDFITIFAEDGGNDGNR